ncbi:MAG: DCC1-like thiol-disulfide oxidoreductase family protein [Gemmatimonadota bacterium]
MRRWGLPAALALLLLAWWLIIAGMLPDLVARAYRGEGLDWLAARMDGRGRIPLDEYLGDVRLLGIRVGSMLALLLAVSLGWAGRRYSASGPWLDPAPLRDLAVLRVVVFGLQLGFLLWPGVPGASPMSDPAYNALLAATSSDGYAPILAMKLLLPLVGRPDANLLMTIWAVGVGATTLGMVGWGRRIPMLVAAWSASVLVAHGYSYGEYHHPEALHGVALWLVALAPATRAFSLDEYRARVRVAGEARGFRPRSAPALSPHARWPITLLGLFFAMTYFNAAVEKLINGGLAWFGSQTLAYHVAVDATQYDLAPGIWLAEHAAFLAPLSYGAWLIEFLFPLTLVFAVAVPILVGLAGAMHIGIWVIHGPPFLQHIVLLPFPFQETFRDLRVRWFGRPGRLRVLYDGHCDLCIRSMTALETLDVTDRLSFVDLEDGAGIARVPEVNRSDALSWMHVAADDGTVWRGFFAFRRLARAMPALWPALLVLHAPLSSSLGPRVYDAVARRRSRRGCRIDV